MNENEGLIARAIIRSATLHYSDIAKLTGKSRKTIAKYLDQLEVDVKQYGVQLVRKPNVGLYFTGDVTKLSDALKLGDAYQNSDTKKQRTLSLLSALLTADGPITIQDLADKGFVSRITFERELKDVSQIIKNQHADIVKSQGGIQLKSSEKIRRRLMVELLNMYWGQGSYLESNKNVTIKADQMPGDVSEFFDADTLGEVRKSLQQFEDEGGMQFSDYQYQSLMIHLVIAIQRIRQHEFLNHVEDQRELDSSTRRLVDILENNLGISIPLEEQQYINIHILAAKGTPVGLTHVLPKQDEGPEKELTDFLKSALTSYDEILLNNLKMHLLPAIKRLSLGLTLHNPYAEQTKTYFPHAYIQAVELGVKLHDHYHVQLNDDELAFIALHIEAYIERHKFKVNAVLVCSTGLGTARLLEQRIKEYFSESINVSRVLSVQELNETPITEDLVISTVDVGQKKVPVIVVPPFLDDHSVSCIKTKVKTIESARSDSLTFVKLIPKQLVFFRNQEKDAGDVIRFMGHMIVQQGYGSDGLIEAAIKREQMASTAIGTVAMPHTPIQFVNKPCIAVYINRSGVYWNTNSVNVVFFFALNQEVKPYVEQIYSHFNNVLEDKLLVKRLSSCTTSDEVFKLLGGGEYE